MGCQADTRRVPESRDESYRRAAAGTREQALEIAKQFVRGQPDAEYVFVDQATAEDMGDHWAVYFPLRQRFVVPPDLLVTVEKKTGTPRWVKVM